MRKNIINKAIFVTILALLPVFSYAADPGLGAVASNLMAPVELVSSFMSSASLAIGICLLFASFLKYLQFRVNPQAYPISIAAVLFLLGLVLVCLPMIYKLTDSGIPFKL